MNHDLNSNVESFLKTQVPRHSLRWRDEIIARISKLNSKFPSQHIRRTHSELLTEMINSGKRFIHRKFKSYSKQRIEDIVNNALLSWLRYFDGNKGIEGQYFRLCIWTEISVDYETENPLLEDGAISGKIKEDKLSDKGGEQEAEKIRAVKVSSDFFENVTEVDIPNDDLIYSSNVKTEDIIISLSDVLASDVDKVANNDYEPLSRENKLLNACYYDNVRSRTEDAKVKKEMREVNLQNEISRITSAEILFRHYQLKNAVTILEERVVPIFSKQFVPRKSFVDEINSERWNGFYTATRFFKKRLSFLKQSADREYMELCISVLKDGIIAFEKEIVDGFFKKSDRGTIPVLSAVAVDHDNKLINFCYKGQIVSYNPQGERRSFQKHCEFTLIEEILTAKNELKKLAGGTLYVTLEPCNKRTFYCQNGKCNESCGHEHVQVKIPCAVKCLESGVAKIFIGSYDTNPTVERKGVEILESGCYTFDLINGQFYSLESNTKKHDKEIRSQQLLENYFITKGYTLILSNSDKKVYRINSGIQVRYFHADLAEEICELNGHFLAAYQRSKFH